MGEWGRGERGREGCGREEGGVAEGKEEEGRGKSVRDCGRDEEGNSIWDYGEREGLADGRESVIEIGRGRGRRLECAGLWEG